jgi:uncharacterized protein YutD
MSPDILSLKNTSDCGPLENFLRNKSTTFENVKADIDAATPEECLAFIKHLSTDYGLGDFAKQILKVKVVFANEKALNPKDEQLIKMIKSYLYQVCNLGPEFKNEEIQDKDKLINFLNNYALPLAIKLIQVGYFYKPQSDELYRRRNELERCIKSLQELVAPEVIAALKKELMDVIEEKTVLEEENKNV